MRNIKIIKYHDYNQYVASMYFKKQPLPLESPVYCAFLPSSPCFLLLALQP